MKRKKEARELRRIAKDLRRVWMGSQHVSRSDNLELFETVRRLEAIADRVEVRYEPAQLMVQGPITTGPVQAWERLVRETVKRARGGS